MISVKQFRKTAVVRAPLSLSLLVHESLPRDGIRKERNTETERERAWRLSSGTHMAHHARFCYKLRMLLWTRIPEFLPFFFLPAAFGPGRRDDPRASLTTSSKCLPLQVSGRQPSCCPREGVQIKPQRWGRSVRGGERKTRPLFSRKMNISARGDVSRIFFCESDATSAPAVCFTRGSSASSCRTPMGARRWWPQYFPHTI